ncbi:hypothetical protein RZS08_39700, partial [Arthrospira platensis SPKY1]|nr:hypothetical protein [Arthrospira platensis SPKY1]
MKQRFRRRLRGQRRLDQVASGERVEGTTEPFGMLDPVVIGGTRRTHVSKIKTKVIGRDGPVSGPRRPGQVIQIRQTGRLIGQYVPQQIAPPRSSFHS